MSVDRSTAIARALAVPDPRLADSDALWSPDDVARTVAPARSTGGPGDSSLVLAYGERSSETPIEPEDRGRFH